MNKQFFKNALTILKSPFAMVAELEMWTVHYATSIVTAIAFFPLIGNETSGRAYGPILGAYKKVFDGAAAFSDRAQMAQLKLLCRIGLLDIGSFTENFASRHMHSERPHDYAGHVNYIYKLNRIGVLSDSAAQQELEGIYFSPGHDRRFESAAPGRNDLSKATITDKNLYAAFDNRSRGLRGVKERPGTASPARGPRKSDPKL